MPELRKDPIAGSWVIIATERSKRPSDFVSGRGPAASQACPFCPSNEGLTPPEIYAVRPPGSVSNGPGWQIRVVPNKYPALLPAQELQRRSLGRFEAMSGIGVHEVVIESPHHDHELSDLPVEHIEKVVEVYSMRLRRLYQNPHFQYVLLFKNRGEVAGASLAHPHSQIIALPFIPELVQELIDAARSYYEWEGRCLWCELLEAELRLDRRIIEERDGYVVLAPFASRFPFEFEISPRSHTPDFTAMTSAQRAGLARVLKRTLGQLKELLNDPPYHFFLQTAPKNLPNEPAFHWHLKIIPRLTKIAGLELATNCYINPTPPEEAARHLRRSIP